MAFSTAGPVFAASADPSTTTITAGSNSVSVDIGSTTITVQAKDSSNTNLTTGGDTVTMTADQGIGALAVTDNGNGTYSATLTDTTAQVVTVSGTINGDPITSGNAQVTFTPGAANASRTTISSADATLSVDTAAGTTITVQAKDQYGNDLTSGGDTVILSATGAASLTAVSDKTNGTYTATLTDTTAEKVSVSGTINTAQITSGDAKVTFTPGAAGASKTTIASSSSSVSVDDPAPTITVQAKDQYGNNLTTGGDTVSLSATGNASVGTPTDNGNGTYTATLMDTTAEVITVSGTINSAQITSGNAQVTFTPGAATHFDVSGFTTPTIAGDSHTFTVTAKDQYNNNATGYTGTVTFTSSDGQPDLPTDYTFTGSGTGNDNGVHTFSATLKTAGSQSLTATDAASSSITGIQSGITVYPAPLHHFVVAAVGGGLIGDQTAGGPFSIQITAKDQYGNTLSAGPNTFIGTVNITSSQTCSSGCGTSPAFSDGVLSSHSMILTLAAASGATITATKTGGTESGNSSGFTVNPATLEDFVVEKSGGGAIGTQTAGTPFSIQITAKDQYGNTESFGPNAFTGTVDVSSPQNCTAGCTTTTAFTAGVLSGYSVTLTLAAPSGASITATKTGGTATGTSTPFIVKPGPLDHFVVTTVGSQAVGHSFNVTITAYDHWNNVKTDYTGAHAILSGLASSPGCPSCVTPGGAIAATYGTKSWPAGTGVGTYSGVLAYNSQTGAQLTISDTSNTEGNATNTSNTFTVTPAAAKYLFFSDPNIGFDGNPVDTKVSTPIYHVCVPSGSTTGDPCIASSSTPTAVVAVDQYGNRVSGVSVTINSATPQAPPAPNVNTGGTTTVATQSGTPGVSPYGEAAFANLTIATLQTFSLNATASGVTTGHSSNFRSVSDLKGCIGQSNCTNSGGNGKPTNATQYAFGQITSPSTFSSVVLTTQFSLGSDTSGKCGNNNRTIGDSIELRAAGGTVIPTTNGYLLLIIPKNTLKADGVLSRGTPSFNVCLGTIYLGDTNGNAYGTNTAAAWFGKRPSGSGLIGASKVFDDAANVWRYWGTPALCGTSGLGSTDPCIYRQTKQKSDITALVTQGILAAGADANMHDSDLAIVIKKPNPWDGKGGVY